MASVIAFIKVFAVLVLLVVAVIIIAEFLYKRHRNWNTCRKYEYTFSAVCAGRYVIYKTVSGDRSWIKHIKDAGKNDGRRDWGNK